MELVTRLGCELSSLAKPGGILVVFGNMLPDNLPVVGVPPEVSHDMDRADRLMDELPALGTGVKAHLYVDNLTHCGSVMDDKNYGDSIALKLGLELMENTQNRYLSLLDRFSSLSTAYTLHTVIELAADVLAAENCEVIEIVENAWSSLGGYPPQIVELLSRAYDVDKEKLLEGISKFPPKNRPSPKILYSRPARAELFLRKFAPPDYDQTKRDQDRAEVVDMIEAGEEMLRDRLIGIVDDFATRILDAAPKLGDNIKSRINNSGLGGI